MLTHALSLVALWSFFRWAVSNVHPSRRDDGSDIYQLSDSRRGKF